MSMEAWNHHKKMEADKLPLSVIESNILSRLPAKSLGRCMCVCKQWKSILSTPTFTKMHLDHVTINDYKLLLLEDETPVTFRTLTFDHGSTTIRPNPNPSPDPSVKYIITSLDGIVCLGLYKANDIAFWNPLTGAYKKLSSNPGIAFSYDPSLDIIAFYKDSSDDYKLLYLANWDFDCRAYIYSNRLDSWRKIDFLDDSDNLICNGCSQPTFFGHSLYFTATDITTRDESHDWIICFDVNTEKFRKIRYPPVLDCATKFHGSFAVVNGCFQLCVTYKLEIIPYKILERGEMWGMDGDAWVKVADFIGSLGGKLRKRVLCVTTNGRLAILESNNSFTKLSSEDLAPHFWYFGSPNWFYRHRQVIYVETLVSPNS